MTNAELDALYQSVLPIIQQILPRYDRVDFNLDVALIASWDQPPQTFEDWVRSIVDFNKLPD